MFERIESHSVRYSSSVTRRGAASERVSKVHCRSAVTTSKKWIMKLSILSPVLIALAASTGCVTEQGAGNCISEIQYNWQLLQRNPKAAAACSAVLTIQGQKWARFKARVMDAN